VGRRVRERRDDHACLIPPIGAVEIGAAPRSTTWGGDDYMLVKRCESAENDTAHAEQFCAEGCRPACRESRRSGSTSKPRSIDLTVLISGGEAGSMESVAHRITRHSERRNRP